MLKHLIVSLVCLSLWSVPSVSEADTTLRRKFTLGQVQKWKMSTKTTLTVTFGEQKHETLMTTVTDVETVCDEVAASGVAKLRLKVTRVLLTTESAMAMNMKLAYDTNDPPPTDATLMVYDKMYRPMIGQDTPMKSDSQGKLSDLVVPKKVRDSDQANSANMGGTTSEDWLRYMAETLTVSLPLTPIKVGGKWSATSELKYQSGTMATTSEFTYRGADDKLGHEKADVELTTKFEPAEKPGKMTLKWSDGNGHILFDNKLGRLIRSETRMAMEFEMEAGEQKIPMVMDNVITVELVVSE